MKILAPICNLDSAILQIESGANEIYISGDTDAFHTLTFSGRAKHNIKGERICVNKQELKEIVDYSHSKNVSVMYTANLPFFADNISNEHDFRKGFLDYVSAGIEAGVDSIVISDLGAILLLNKENIIAHYTLSTYQETMNSNQLMFFQQLGIKRIVLSYHVTLDEIVEIAKNSPNMELEVFGHFGCSFYSDCNLKHGLGERDYDCIGTPCRNYFQIYDEVEQLLFEGQILNFSLACSICSLYTLMTNGIYALKLVGRDMDMRQNAIITQVYSKALKYVEESYERNYSKNCILETLPQWWKKTLCERRQCKYLDNLITQSYVDKIKGDYHEKRDLHSFIN